jgi:hypothetical protein
MASRPGGREAASGTVWNGTRLLYDPSAPPYCSYSHSGEPHRISELEPLNALSLPSLLEILCRCLA